MSDLQLPHNFPPAPPSPVGLGSSTQIDKEQRNPNVGAGPPAPPPRRHAPVQTAQLASTTAAPILRTGAGKSIPGDLHEHRVYGKRAGRVFDPDQVKVVLAQSEMPAADSSITDHHQVRLAVVSSSAEGRTSQSLSQSRLAELGVAPKNPLQEASGQAVTALMSAIHSRAGEAAKKDEFNVMKQDRTFGRDTTVSSPNGRALMAETTPSVIGGRSATLLEDETVEATELLAVAKKMVTEQGIALSEPGRSVGMVARFRSYVTEVARHRKFKVPASWNQEIQKSDKDIAKELGIEVRTSRIRGREKPFTPKERRRIEAKKQEYKAHNERVKAENDTYIAQFYGEGEHEGYYAANVYSKLEDDSAGKVEMLRSWVQGLSAADRERLSAVMSAFAAVCDANDIPQADATQRQLNNREKIALMFAPLIFGEQDEVNSHICRSEGVTDSVEVRKRNVDTGTAMAGVLCFLMEHWGTINGA